MKRIIKWSVILLIVGLIGGAVLVPTAAYMRERRRITYREADVTRGRIVAVVNSTGTVKPVQSVSVGAFVSGPIKELNVDFNYTVNKGALLAKIDPLLYQAAVARDAANLARDTATLATRKADVGRVKALWQQAKNDEARGKALFAENKKFISTAELDQQRFLRKSVEAQLKVVKAMVLEAQSAVDSSRASLDSSKANLDYTDIVSPVDGVIIDRKVDRGQTVAASFQTPELFVVAPDLKEVHIFATVDETDIGLIQAAKLNDQPVLFTVDAHPDDLFHGKISQIRLSSTTTQNVVTYPVVVSAANPDLKLLPGMTASLSFQLRAADNVLRIPSGALRLFPQRDQVRPEDRHLLETKFSSTSEAPVEMVRSAEEKAKLRAKRNTRHLWVVDGAYLKAVEVVIGLSDNNFTEIVSGDLQEGGKVVIGVQPRE